MKSNIHNRGYTLVEVLVAVSILMLSIVGPITIAAKSLQGAQFTRQQNTAFFLAQEGISLVNAMRNDAELAVYTGGSTNAWSWIGSAALAPCFTASGCDIDARDETFTDNVVACATADACQLQFDETRTRAVYQHVSGSPTPYVRTIKLKLVTPDEVAVSSEVTWTSKLLGGAQTVSLDTSLFNLYKE